MMLEAESYVRSRDEKSWELAWGKVGGSRNLFERWRRSNGSDGSVRRFANEEAAVVNCSELALKAGGTGSGTTQFSNGAQAVSGPEF